MTKAQMLRAALARGARTAAAGVHDGLGARVAEDAGFDVLWASGLGISASHAVPDDSVLTMTEFLTAARVIDEASRLPVLADCDTGFGDAANTARAVSQYERAGVAGICIEDKVFPKRNSLGNGAQTLEDVDVFCEKLRRAKAAQSSEDFVVVARVETFIAGGTQAEAIERADAYVAAGADAILMHSKSTDGAEVIDFARAWSDRETPLLCVPTTYPTVDANELRDAGYGLIIYANQALRATVTAMRETLRTIAEQHSTESVEDRIAPLDELFDLQSEA